MDNRINLSVVIPVYNEEDNVDILYNEIVRALPDEQFNFEVVFVDDGSTDRTLSCLKSKAQTSPKLQIVAHKRNAGQSAALVSGVRAARFNLIATLDGDGQNDPADIPRLIACIKNSRTVILGNRARRDDNRLRRISSRVGNGVRRRLLKDECPDTGCSLKIFPREAF